MADTRILAKPWVVAPVLGLGVMILGAGSVRADRIVLRGGGQVRGKVIPDPNRPDRVTVLAETGKTPLVFQKPQVLKVVAERGVLDDYLVERDKASLTADAQYALGLWSSDTSCPAWP